MPCTSRSPRAARAPSPPRSGPWCWWCRPPCPARRHDPGALAVARAAGRRLVPVPANAFGVLPGLLADAFARTGAVGLRPPARHPQPGLHGAGAGSAPPGGAGGRRRGLRVRDRGRMRPGGSRTAAGARPPTPLAAYGTAPRAYLTSLTRPPPPAADLAGHRARPGRRAAAGPARVDDMSEACPVEEVALTRRARGLAPHRAGLAQALTGRARALAGALARHAPGVAFIPPAGGMHLGPAAGRAGRRRGGQAARWSGVAVMPGRPFFPAEPPGPYLRLTFSAARPAATSTPRCAAWPPPSPSWPAPRTAEHRRPWLTTNSTR